MIVMILPGRLAPGARCDTMISVTETLVGFDVSPFAHDGVERDVYRAGSGPAVIVIHEVPGLHPGVIAFGQRLVDAGFTAYLPSLFGTPGHGRIVL